MASKRKRIVACDVCRERKVKCNGELPCTNCLDRGEKCFLSDRKQRRRLLASEDDLLVARLSRIESLLDGKASRHPDAATNPTKTSTKHAHELPASSQPTPERTEPSQEDGSTYSVDTSNLEYVDPRTFLSVCSAPAISWISSQLGNDGFQPVAGRLLRDITNRLRPSRSVPLERKPEPSPEDALKYAEAYFSEAQETAFGVLSKEKFQNALQKTFRSDKAAEFDPAWYALRNIVYAYGSRILLSRAATFREANNESQGWFFNALAVHTDILYLRTSIVGLLALILMAYYTEGLGGPSLQHMLVTCAVRLACAKGLHRQPCSSWKLQPDEASHRNWVFWAIYCLDKHISIQSGRPSVTSDEEINCSIPSTSSTSNHANANVNAWYCTQMVRMAKLLSRIARELSSANAMAQRPEKALDRVRELDEEIQEFADSVKNVMNLKQPSSPPSQSVGLSPEQTLRIRLMCFEVVFALHSTISRPWLRLVCLNQTESAPYQDQILYSTEITATTSRNVILACANMYISAQCPHWSALTVPLTACINLFIYILQDPFRPSTQSDLSLLEVGAGHFARLDFATQSTISHSFVREIAQLAREMVLKADAPKQQDAGMSSGNKIPGQLLRGAHVSTADQDTIGLPSDFDLDAWFNMEMWLPIEF